MPIKNNKSKKSEKEKENNLTPEQEKEKKIYDELTSLLKLLINEYYLTTKYANILGQQRVQYIKGKDLVEFIKYEDNFKDLRERFKKIVNIDVGNEPNKDSFQKMFDIFFTRKILLKLNRIEGDKSKYPKRLVPPKIGEDVKIFEENKFYWVNLKEEKNNKQYIYLGITITILFLGCLYPIWPLKVQLGFWYTILIILIILLIFTSLILVVAILGIIVGYDVLILPNLFEPRMPSFKSRFTPFVAVIKREDDWVGILFRICAGTFIICSSILCFLNRNYIIIAYNFCINMFKKFNDMIVEKIKTSHKGQIVKENNKYQNIFDVGDV